ncbi:MAG: Uma2 family endonuclease [Leptolyngbyaceae cyanobacterium SL_7_1]|nr:Uma2 family endonuclease [Leptolyngbyaceae cyanobacterium SL_7_1]
MSVTIPIHQIRLQPGSVISIPQINWAEFEEILRELGENRNARIAYSQATLEIMVPLPEHERAIVVIADLVKIVLRIQCRPWESLRSSTFKRLNMAGVEPDDCFYIQNQQAVIGKNRLDLSIDPPPDLAIESDVTSKTRTDAYLAIAVPELWIYDAGILRIKVLQGDRYVDSSISPTFPDLPIPELVAKTVERATQIGTSQALLEFEDWLNDSREPSREKG